MAVGPTTSRTHGVSLSARSNAEKDGRPSEPCRLERRLVESVRCRAGRLRGLAKAACALRVSEADQPKASPG